MTKTTSYALTDAQAGRLFSAPPHRQRRLKSLRVSIDEPCWGGEAFLCDPGDFLPSRVGLRIEPNLQVTRMVSTLFCLLAEKIGSTIAPENGGTWITVEIEA
jgi:hypothetical protein